MASTVLLFPEPLNPVFLGTEVMRDLLRRLQRKKKMVNVIKEMWNKK